MKTKIIVLFALILSPFFVFGATKIINVTPIEWYEAIGQINTSDAKEVLIYRVEDKVKKNTCYVAYMNGFTNGMSLGISCVK